MTEHDQRLYADAERVEPPAREVMRESQEIDLGTDDDFFSKLAERNTKLMQEREKLARK